MRRITFVRHAESVSNAGGITMEHAAVPLSERGRQQARRIAAHLPNAPNLVLVSPMLRTVETAEPYCDREGRRPQTFAALAEFSVICPSLIANLSREERKPYVAAYWASPDPHRRTGPGADTFREFNGRVREFEERLPNLPDGTTVFGHGIWFGLLLWRLLGYSAEDASDMSRFRRFQLGLPMPNCAVFMLTCEGCSWSVRVDEKATRAAHAVEG